MHTGNSSKTSILESKQNQKTIFPIYCIQCPKSKQSFLKIEHFYSSKLFKSLSEPKKESNNWQNKNFENELFRFRSLYVLHVNFYYTC